MPIGAKDALDRYAQEHIPTGGFLRAALANDFMEAVGRADHINLQSLHDIARYIYNNMPSTCHGSYDIVDAWLGKENT